MRFWYLTKFSGVAALSVQSIADNLGSPSTTNLVPRTWNGTRYGCKCYLGDSCWPSSSQWKALNDTVGGNLQVDIPPGAPCYNVFQGPLGNISTYNAAKCANVTAEFANEQWTYV